MMGKSAGSELTSRSVKPQASREDTTDSRLMHMSFVMLGRLSLHSIGLSPIMSTPSSSSEETQVSGNGFTVYTLEGYPLLDDCLSAVG